MLHLMGSTVVGGPCEPRGVKKPHLVGKNHTEENLARLSDSAVRARIMRRASLADVLKWRDMESRPSVASRRVWGPVSEEDAASVGCIQGAASVVIIQQIPPDVVSAAL